jgi:hypothetical protein
VVRGEQQAFETAPGNKRGNTAAAEFFLVLRALLGGFGYFSSRRNGTDGNDGVFFLRILSLRRFNQPLFLVGFGLSRPIDWARGERQTILTMRWERDASFIHSFGSRFSLGFREKTAAGSFGERGTQRLENTWANNPPFSLHNPRFWCCGRKRDSTDSISWTNERRKHTFWQECWNP